MPLQATSGAASYDAFGGGVASVPLYIEDVFSTYLYQGNTTSQTINNGLDLATKGGMVWTKRRSGADSHTIFDTSRPQTYAIYPNQAYAQTNEANSITGYTTTGYSIGSGPALNANHYYVSWAWRKQPKFFDMVTYVGNGAVGGITVNHNLGSVPGMIIIKNLSNPDSWLVWHRGMSGYAPYMFLESTQQVNTSGGISSVSSTSFTYPWTYTTGNGAGQYYQAFIFAHNAGGFGLSGLENAITCGSVTANSSGNATVNLGYEPQYILLKRATAGAEGWILIDTMRNMSSQFSLGLFANSDVIEFNNTAIATPTPTGFAVENAQLQASQTYIYMAIRKGPMKVPTDATKVFAPVVASPWPTAITTTNFPVDLSIKVERSAAGNQYKYVYQRLTGGTKTNAYYLATNSTGSASAYTGTYGYAFDFSTGVLDNGLSYFFHNISNSCVSWNLRRAPNFFESVQYLGNNTTGGTIDHGLGVVPELVIVKSRNNGGSWYVTCPSILGTNKYLTFSAAVPTTYTLFSAYSATQITKADVGTGDPDAVSVYYSMWLFATCPGVSKVGSYTGNGSSQTINCGFTSGARLVLIKRTNAEGSWYVWDSARGIVTGNDSYLEMDTINAENSSGVSDAIDADSTGFIVNQTTQNNVNVNGSTYIFLAIA